MQKESPSQADSTELSKESSELGEIGELKGDLESQTPVEVAEDSTTIANILPSSPTTSSGATEKNSSPVESNVIPVNRPVKTHAPISRSAISYPVLILFSSVVIALGITTAIARYLTRQPNSSFNPAQLQRFVLRLRAWWTICLFVVFGLVVHRIGIIILFGLISFWAFREFITMTPTRRGDHRALFWSLVVFTPLQYILIGLGETNWQWNSGQPIDFYGVYSIMIPVYASLFIPARIAMAARIISDFWRDQRR